ncbi:unnamed protein product [Larinioides sclopetarius]|uniref:Uncharacterized protein n=1 Tax=Larinioides sclopetarius TaxID=280406 RepID=A0AAV2ADU8_9ARAC
MQTWDSNESCRKMCFMVILQVKEIYCAKKYACKLSIKIIINVKFMSQIYQLTGLIMSIKVHFYCLKSHM